MGENFILVSLIKIIFLLTFGIPLILSAAFAGIMGLILGWIISPDFISLSFTVTNPADPRYNPFVAIGLSITKGFANMGFILFLVVIALATVLRIEEYKAKKTLLTLILIALLVNFSPVFCGIIIDFSNILMNFFLSAITGITGFSSFLIQSGNEIYNLIFGSGWSLGATIGAAMQVVVSLAFNLFAGYIFVLFSALFIMRYIMLWILVILSPIAFVSYILPITRRGGSLLNWREWWKQMTSWSIIGIIAGFFLYLGFNIISMINAKPDLLTKEPGIQGLGLMNNVLPYLIPLVILWIAYKETKRTSAMFAGDVIQFTEKIGKTAVTAATMMAAAGAGMAVKAAGAAGGRIKGAAGTMADEEKWGKWKGEHPTVGKIFDKPAGGMQWAGRRKEDVETKIVAPVKKGVEEKITAPLKQKVDAFKEKHPEFTKYASAAKKGLTTAITGKGEKEVEGRPLNEAERNQQPDQDGNKYRYEEKTVKTPMKKRVSEMEGYRKQDFDNAEFYKDPLTGKEVMAKPEQKGYVEWEQEEKKSGPKQGKINTKGNR